MKNSPDVTRLKVNQGDMKGKNILLTSSVSDVTVVMIFTQALTNPPQFYFHFFTETGHSVRPNSLYDQRQFILIISSCFLLISIHSMPNHLIIYLSFVSFSS